jgi:hypothetical protein
MNKLKLSLACISLAACFLTGCSEQQLQPLKQVCVPAAYKARAMQVAEDTIGKMNFTIDKSDVEKGYLLSRPLPAGQFFEFWKHDNVSQFNFEESNLQNIRRTVEINIDQQQADQICIRCNVVTQRLSVFDYKHDSGPDSVKYDRFSGEGKIELAQQKLKLSKEQMTWVNLGSDEKLSTVILKQIEKQLTPKSK